VTAVIAVFFAILFVYCSFNSFLILHLFTSCVFSVFSLLLYIYLFIHLFTYLFIYSIIHRTSGVFSWCTHSSFGVTESKCTIYKVTRRLISMERFSAFEAALKCVINNGFRRYVTYSKHNLKNWIVKWCRTESNWRGSSDTKNCVSSYKNCECDESLRTFAITTKPTLQQRL